MDPRLAELESALVGRGFCVQRVADMDGWLAYHAAFVACIAAALYRCGTCHALPGGGLCFAAHSRHAEAEMRALGYDVAARVTVAHPS